MLATEPTNTYAHSHFLHRPLATDYFNRFPCLNKLRRTSKIAGKWTVPWPWRTRKRLGRCTWKRRPKTTLMFTTFLYSLVIDYLRHHRRMPQSYANLQGFGSRKNNKRKRDVASCVLLQRVSFMQTFRHIIN